VASAKKRSPVAPAVVNALFAATGAASDNWPLSRLGSRCVIDHVKPLETVQLEIGVHDAAHRTAHPARADGVVMGHHGALARALAAAMVAAVCGCHQDNAHAPPAGDSHDRRQTSTSSASRQVNPTNGSLPDGTPMALFYSPLKGHQCR